MIEPPGEHRRRSGKSQSPAYRHEPHAGPAPAGRRSPRGRARWPWVAAGLVLMVLCLVGGCVAVVAGIANEVGEDADREAR